MDDERAVSSLRNIVFTTLVVALFVGTALGFTGMISIIDLGPSQINEPLSGTDTGQTWTSTLYPNESTTHSFEVTNSKSSEDYILKMEIESFDDVNTGLLTSRSAAVAAARDNNHSAYISNFTIHDSHGFQVDLLNDGVAYYNTLPPNSTETGYVTIRVNEDTQNYGTVSLNLSFERVDSLRYEGSLYHEDSGIDCTGSYCHTSSKAVTVHKTYGATDDSECANCHGRSMQDTHMSCIAACHNDGYPISINDSSDYDHGPNSPKGVDGNYYCADNCHGTHISSSHTKQLPQYCGSCHESGNETIFKFHNKSISDDCIQCHGMKSEKIHSPYEITEERNQCTRCHGTDISGNAQITQDVIYRVNAGGSTISSTDSGPDWQSSDSVGGLTLSTDASTTISTSDSITWDGDEPEALFQSAREENDRMTWTFDNVNSGDYYTVTLYFAEIEYTEEHQREFDVDIEGDQVLDEYDILDNNNHDEGVSQSYTVKARRGDIDIEFDNRDGGAVISAIEISK